MSTRRIARRVALRGRRQNACTDAVNAQTVETKVLHSVVHPFLVCGQVGRTDGGSRARVPERLSIAGPSGGCRRQAGGEPCAYLSDRPSRRVAVSVACNTFPFLLIGNERKKTWC